MPKILDAIIADDDTMLEQAIAEMVRDYIVENKSKLMMFADPATRFPEKEREVLEEMGVFSGEFDIQPLLKGALDRKMIFETALTIENAAKLLEVSEDDILSRIDEGSLLGIFENPEDEWVLPSWQFMGSRELPGWSSVVHFIPSDLDILSIYGFMTTPQPDLEDNDGNATTPLDWLKNFNDPKIVAWLAKAL